MDRTIRPYGHGASTPSVPSAPAQIPPISSTLPKSASDFARALRRRFWLVLGVGLVVGLSGSAFIVRMPAIYQADAEIEIEPPQFDAALMGILDTQANVSRDQSEQYVVNRIAQLRSSSLVNEVIVELGLASGGADPSFEIINGLTTKRVGGTTTFFQVYLECRDQDRVAKILNALIDTLSKKMQDESAEEIRRPAEMARSSLNEWTKKLDELDREISVLLASEPQLIPGGKNRLEEEYMTLKSVLLQKRMRFEDLIYEQRVAEMWPELKGPAQAQLTSPKLVKLYQDKEHYEQILLRLKGTVRNYNSDPYVKHAARQLGNVLNQIEQLQQQVRQPRAVPNRAELHISRAADDLRDLERQVEEQEETLHAKMPTYQEYLAKLRQREDFEQKISETRARLEKFEMVSKTVKPPIRIRQRASDPMAPVRPNRPMAIAGVSVFGLLLGVALVCLLESLDHKVKAPEHLVHGLTLPLFGVVPRFRRQARLIRGGHFWTAAAPDSPEADAFRNIRASLLGAEDPRKPFVTIQVASAKPGEGKSTVALNLALTSALAGERTMLIDADLRHSSLAEVFGADNSLGLVDVLQGLLPFQRVAVRTEIPNLSFLPCGDSSSVPREVLASLELKQLLSALSGQYHRVIIDSASVLGIADGRMLGQMTDATILVVRSGAHDLRPLRWAKEWLEQSRVKIAGVVFNGLNEGLSNWSCDPARSLSGQEDASARGRGLSAPSAGVGQTS